MPHSQALIEQLFDQAMHCLHSGDIDQAIDLLHNASHAHHLEAMVQLGHIYVQNYGPNFAHQTGFDWYLKAAQQGYAPAQCRVADCYMRGLGVALDDQQAFHWYQKVAQQGIPFALSNLAYMYQQGIGTAPDATMAARYYLMAAILGDGYAFCALSLSFLAGDGVPQDDNMALSFAMLAKAIDYPNAQTVIDHVVNSSTSTLIDPIWFEGLKQTIMSAQPHLFGLPIVDVSSTLQHYQPAILHYLTTLNARLLDFTQFPSAAPYTHHLEPKTLSLHPQIITIENFLNPALCCYLMYIAKEYLGDSDQLHQSTLTHQQTFEGGSAVFSAPRCDAIVRHIERRMAQAINVPVNHLEPLSVLCYVKGEQYAPHVDYFDEKRLAELKVSNPRSFQAGQRVYTFLVYLSPAEQGGETYYLNINQKISGCQGQAVIHANCQPDGKIDPDSLHQGMPIIKGEKWLLRCAIRSRALANN